MANFVFNPPFPSQVANSTARFNRSFAHTPWVDGQDLVQAGTTANEEGINARFFKLQNDLDLVKGDLENAHRLIAELRTALAGALNQIRDELNRKTDKPAKETKDGKEGKDAKEGKDGKDAKESKDGKESKEGKDAKEHKDGKESKEGKEDKDGKELAAKEKDHNPREQIPAPIISPPLEMFATEEELTPAPIGRAFIRPEERPAVGGRLYRATTPPDAAPAADGTPAEKAD